MGGCIMTFTLDTLQASLGELNDQLEVLDNKLRSLEIISDNTFFEIYLLAKQHSVSLELIVSPLSSNGAVLVL
jgi:hypothetical protein